MLKIVIMKDDELFLYLYMLFLICKVFLSYMFWLVFFFLEVYL